MTTKDNRVLSLELMRVFAAFFVIFNHTSSEGHFLFSLYDPQSFQYWVYIFIAAFCHFSVPLFFMISGALLLCRNDETRRRSSLKKAFHMLVVLLVWSFLYYLSTVYDQSNYMTVARDSNPYLQFVDSPPIKFNLIEFFLHVLISPGWNHSYWFLYAYIGFLICLPMLQHMAQALTNRDYIRILCLFVILAMFVPAVQSLVVRNSYNFGASLMGISWIGTNVIIFPFTGYLLQHRLKNFWTKKKLLLLWGGNAVGLLCSGYLTYNTIVTTGNSEEIASQGFLAWSVLINAVTVFVTCQYIDVHTTILKRFKRSICFVSDATFGIYLTHLYFLHRSCLAAASWKILCGDLHMGPMLYAFIYCIIIFVCSLFITKILQRIPFIRDLIA